MGITGCACRNKKLQFHSNFFGESFGQKKPTAVRRQWGKQNAAVSRIAFEIMFTPNPCAKSLREASDKRDLLDCFKYLLVSVRSG